MTRLLLFILTFGFIIQCSGTALFVTKNIPISEQCPDDNKTGGENSSEDFKSEKDQIGIQLKISVSYFINEDHKRCKNRDYYPPGFYNNPYLPPR